MEGDQSNKNSKLEEVQKSSPLPKSLYLTPLEKYSALNPRKKNDFKSKKEINFFNHDLPLFLIEKDGVGKIYVLQKKGGVMFKIANTTKTAEQKRDQQASKFEKMYMLMFQIKTKHQKSVKKATYEFF